MATQLLLNLSPNDDQLSAINELIGQQKDLLSAMEAIKKKNEENHARLSESAIVFQCTLQSTETLHEISTQMSAQITDWVKRLDTEISAQELNQTLLSSLIPSTTDFIEGWKTVQKAASAFSSILKDRMNDIHDRIRSVLEKLHNAETLRDETADTLTGLSTMIETSQSIIRAKSQGILHPIRRLPPEILLEIFEECVGSEVDELHRQTLFTAPSLPRMPITLSAVCRTWRRTVLRSPCLWSYIRLPLYKLINNWGAWRHTGSDYSINFATRARGVAIELTLLDHNTTVAEELTKMKIHRLNVANVGNAWPPPSNIPSPAHLWLVDSGTSYVTRTIPSTLLSRTTRITCVTVYPEFEAPAKLVASLLLEGKFPALALTSLLGNLPGLRSLDLANSVLNSPPLSTARNLCHSRLASLAIHASALAALEQSLSDGLSLPSIRHFSLNDLTNTNSFPFNFPLTSSQLSATVTELEFRQPKDLPCIRSWIDAFTTLDTISTRGECAKDVLCALYYEMGDKNPSMHGPVSRFIMTEFKKPSVPKGVKTFIIREYKLDGMAIFRYLRDIREHPHPDTEVIKVVFDGCVNIVPNIREGMSRDPPFPGAPFGDSGSTRNGVSGTRSTSEGPQVS